VRAAKIKRRSAFDNFRGFVEVNQVSESPMMGTMMIKNPANYAHPFGDVAELLKRAKAEREQRAEIYRETREIVSRAFDAHTFLDINGAPVTETARRIMLAGMKRRAEITDPRTRPDTSTPSGRKALAIINAGRKARGEEPLK
jgi:hypothetical protein